MKRALKHIDLYLAYSRMSLKALFAFRLDAILRAFAVFARETGGVAVMYLILLRFPSLGGWSMDEALFLYSFLFLSYSILIAVFTGFRDFEETVHSGELDRCLVRPMGIMFQIMASSADYLATIGHGAVGIALFAYSAGRVGIVWDAAKLSYLALAIVAGVVIQGSIFIFFSCLSLWFTRSDRIFRALYHNTRKIAAYPLVIYPEIIRSIVVFAIPFAFVNYFPTLHLLGKPDPMWEGFRYLNAPVAALMLALACLFWRASISRYASTGN